MDKAEIPVPHINRTVGDACRKHKPGMERPVQAEEETGRQIRPSIQSRYVGANKEWKYAGCVPRKSRYCFICARTVN